MIIVYMWRPKDWNPATSPTAVAHIAVAFTGLGRRSFYIDWDSGKTPQFHTTDFWYATKHYGDNPIRVALLTKEDGNEHGLDETAALKWWKQFKATQAFNPLTNNCASAAMKALLAAGASELLPVKPTTDTAAAAEYTSNLSYIVEEKNPHPRVGANIEDFNTKEKRSHPGQKNPDEEKRSQVTLIPAEKLKDEDFMREHTGKKVEIHRQLFGFKFAQEARAGARKLSDMESNATDLLQNKYAFLLALRKACYRKNPNEKSKGIAALKETLKVGVGQSEKEINSMFTRASKTLSEQLTKLGKTANKQSDMERNFYEKYDEMAKAIQPPAPHFRPR